MSKRKRRKTYEYENYASTKGWQHGYCCLTFGREKRRDLLEKAVEAARKMNADREKPQPFDPEKAEAAFRGGFFRGCGRPF